MPKAEVEEYLGFYSEMIDDYIEDGFSEEDLDVIKNSAVDYVTLNKLAIKYADGVIQASPNINPELIEYAKSLGKPFMEYPGAENYIEAYAQFYQSL